MAASPEEPGVLSEGVAEGEGKDLGPVPVPLREGFGPIEVDGNDLSEERKSELETSAGRRPESSAGEVVGITLEEPTVKEGDGPELTEKQRRGILDGSSEQGSSSKRLSLFVGMGTVILSGVAGTVMGIMWAYLGKTFDSFMSMMVTAGLALPDLVLLIIAAQIARQAGVSEILAIVVTLSFTRMWGVTRIYRSAALEVRSRPFVEAAESYGANSVRVMSKHVLPNILPLIIVSSTLALPNAILAEAGLSFLGFGPAGEPSWGQMFAGEAREYFRRQIWMLWAPGLTIGLTVMGFNFWGDAMRDLLDPRLRGTT